MFKFEVQDSSFLPHLGCSLEINLASGEGLILTGPNGIGKTSTLRRIHSDYRKTHSLSFIEQKPLDLFYDRKLGKVRKILRETRPGLLNEELFNLLWNGFGLNQKEGRPLSALSGGELQALKICAGLGRKAQVYLLDEPFQSLDSGRKSFFASVLKDLLKEELSFVVVEHDLSLFTSPWRVQPLQVLEGNLKGGESWTIS